MENKRKYEVTLPDGRVVSRQYAAYLKNDSYKVKHSEASKRYLDKDDNRKHHNEITNKWRDNFKNENGMSYGQWYYRNKKQRYTRSVTD